MVRTTSQVAVAVLLVLLLGSTIFFSSNASAAQTVVLGVHSEFHSTGSSSVPFGSINFASTGSSTLVVVAVKVVYTRGIGDPATLEASFVETCCDNGLQQFTHLSTVYARFDNTGCGGAGGTATAETDRLISVWYLQWPAVQNYDISVGFPTSGASMSNLDVMATTFANVDQGAPLPNFATNQYCSTITADTGTSSLVFLGTPTDMVYDVLALDDTASAVPNAGQTAVVNGPDGGIGRYSSSTITPSTAPSTTTGWSWGARPGPTYQDEYFTIDVQAAAAAGGSGPPPQLAQTVCGNTASLSDQSPQASSAILYQWNFGDGTIATTSSGNVTHTYPSAGTYQGSVAVQYRNGAIQQYSFTVTTGTCDPLTLLAKYFLDAVALLTLFLVLLLILFRKTKRQSLKRWVTIIVIVNVVILVAVFVFFGRLPFT